MKEYDVIIRLKLKDEFDAEDVADLILEDLRESDPHAVPVFKVTEISISELLHRKVV